MAECCTPLVTGAGNAPGRLVVNVVCGDPVNLSFQRCEGWPVDTTATLRLSHPWGWDMEVAGTIAADWLSFHIAAADAREIPREAWASIVLESPGVPPYTWLAGCVHHARGGC
ncbi:hypothetical protein IU501_34685 [Nocardia otitidiscaviarum]|uniref:LtfC-like domain-containing protein n=1 Tax=Nocardia otitidiscaviarum TaxID=1823 RepID=UPI00189400A3|nr:hypothetical protein [Nocardia otitidiscaviarum]MBF6138118.1 hypothetical protein [Nocardia otitidiscaviarum]